jgi:molecular chaperone DnaK (HSP70)
MDNSITLGIDFGTTNSVVSYYNSNTKNVEIIAEIPTVIFFDPFNEVILFGNDAKDALKSVKYNDFIFNGFFHIKRLIGKNQITPDIQPFFKNNQSFIKEDILYFNVLYNNKQCTFTVSEMVYLFFKKMHQMSLDFFSNQSNISFNSILTVPAYFNDNQREFIKQTSEKLNIKVLRILNEPTSASLAYGIDPLNKSDQEEYILTLDCGGGTTDLSYLHMDYSSQIYQVKHVIGDNILGGEDLTHALYEYVSEKLKFNRDTIKPRHKNLIYHECERVKKILSTSQQTLFLLEMGETYHKLTITRAQFMDISRPFFKKMKELIYSLINEIKNATPSFKIDKIIFMGGTTRTPYFKSLFKDILGNVAIHDTIDPDLTVSFGASLYGALLSQSLTEDDDILLLDIIPLSLGIETLGGIMTPIVSRNSLLPISKTHTFTNSHDFEETITISIYQGERRFVKDNFFLTSFEISGLESYPKNSLLIHITFEIDLNNIITAHAQIELLSKNTDADVSVPVFEVKKVQFTQNTHYNIQEILLDSELNKLKDSENATKIQLKIQLYDSFKYLLSVFHEKMEIIDLESEFTISRLNLLFNDTFEVITNYYEYSCEELEKVKESFEEQWHKLIFAFEPVLKDSDGQLIDVGSTVIE